ncbi:MAG: hypothetical protein LBM92_03815, partial [Opitutaceae bacterium]|nr:hypothetical protein [Opitutaceae bacterium]
CYGLPWLIQTCVHLKNGNNEKAVETLFKSYRSLWNDTTARLTSELKKQIMETAREKEKMLLTGEHIKLLYEACRAGSVPDGRDIPANQLALPYPVNPADALVAGESWYAAGAGIRKENSKTNGPFQLYAGLYCEKDERQARCLDFLMLYYEWNIEKEGEKQGKTLSEKNGELEAQFNSKFAPQRNEIEEALKKEKSEIQKGFQTGLVATIGGSPETARKNALDAQERQRNYPVFEAKLYVELYTQIVSEWDKFLLRKADVQKEIYEKEMKPWLEEYWLRVNAMLGYVEDANVRAAYGRKALWTINQNALVRPLVTAGFDADVVNEKRRELNRWKNVLKSAGARAEMLRQQEAQARAKNDLAEQQKQAILQKQKESWDGDFTIKLPLDMGLMGISVSIGMEKGNLKFGYGAFEHEFVHSYNGDGTFGYTAITRASVLPAGLGELSVAANELKDVLKAGGGLKYLAGKANPIGNIPSFDRKIGTGKTYLYDQTGKLVDVVTIRETTTSVGWGPLGASQTTSATTRQSVFGTSFSTKKDVSFGPFTIHE